MCWLYFLLGQPQAAQAQTGSLTYFSLCNGIVIISTGRKTVQYKLFFKGHASIFYQQTQK